MRFGLLLRNSRKTGAVSSSPPKEIASFSIVWRRAAAPFALLLALMAPALVTAKDATETAIRGVLQKQTEDWNRGDIPAFVLSYAENCTFVGTGVTEGRAGVEQRYRQTYPTPDAMGQLTFSDLKIKKMSRGLALVTGAYHLERAAQGGGEKKGIFSLVLKREGGAWYIVLDHTS
jgi:uncharacterized protein (TIGR02246 family)